MKKKDKVGIKSDEIKIDLFAQQLADILIEQVKWKHSNQTKENKPKK